MKTPQMNKIIRARMAERLMFTDHALMTLRGIVQVAMTINVFLLVCEVFTEFYAGGLHIVSSKYLYLGLNGHHALVPWIWTAITFNLTAMVLLVLPVSRSLKWLNVTCVLCIVGIWIEKGMGLVIPGFIPTPLGEMMEYTPIAQRDAGLFWHLGFRPAVLHGFPAHGRADSSGQTFQGERGKTRICHRQPPL